MSKKLTINDVNLKVTINFHVYNHYVLKVLNIRENELDEILFRVSIVCNVIYQNFYQSRAVQEASESLLLLKCRHHAK